MPKSFILKTRKQKEKYSLKIFNKIVEFFNDNKELFDEALKFFNNSNQINSCNINFKVLKNVLDELLNNLPESNCCSITSDSK